MSFSFIQRHIDRQLFGGAWPVTAEGLALYRIAFCVVMLVLAARERLWIADYPTDAISPPPGPIALLPDLAWGMPAAVVLTVVMVAAMALVLCGWRTLEMSILLAVVWLLRMGIGFSFGKIDHTGAITFVVLLLAPFWGAAWSLDRRQGRPARSAPPWLLPFTAWVLGLMFFTAAWPKLRGHWLDPGTSAVHSLITEQLIVHERSAFLAGWIAEQPWNPTFELLDWSAVLFEGSLVFLAVSLYRFRWGLAVGAIFHLSVFLTMNISFSYNLVFYAVFLPLPLLATRLAARPAFGTVARRLGERSSLVIAATCLLVAGAVSAALIWVDRVYGETTIDGFDVMQIPSAIVVVIGGVVGAAVLVQRLLRVAAGPRRTGGVLIYDSDCGFCTRYATWADERMAASTVRSFFEAPDLLERHGLTVDDCLEASWWVDEHGPPLKGERAIAQSLLQMGPLHKVAGALLFAPGISYISAIGYRFIAENRQLMPGGTPACAAPVLRD